MRAPNCPARGLGIIRTSIIVHICCLPFLSHENPTRNYPQADHLCARTGASTLHCPRTLGRPQGLGEALGSHPRAETEGGPRGGRARSRIVSKSPSEKTLSSRVGSLLSLFFFGRRWEVRPGSRQGRPRGQRPASRSPVLNGGPGAVLGGPAAAQPARSCRAASPPPRAEPRWGRRDPGPALRGPGSCVYFLVILGCRPHDYL